MTRHIPPALRSQRALPATALRGIAGNPAPGSDEELTLTALERLAGLPDQIRQTVTDALWQSIPQHVQEFGRFNGWATGSPLVVSPQIGELVKITLAVVSVPAGCVATLTLGDHTFPNLNPGVSNLQLARLLNASDVRQLSCDSGAGGQASLALYGTQLAPTGNMAP
jgi:hypothetical protein